jgi:hypothetical protein
MYEAIHVSDKYIIILLHFLILFFLSTVQQKPQCTLDSDCSDSDKCVRSHCVKACQVDMCGVNAVCNSYGHRALCSCPPGYEGNPHIECTKGKILHPEYVKCYIIPFVVTLNFTCGQKCTLSASLMMM